MQIQHQFQNGLKLPANVIKKILSIVTAATGITVLMAASFLSGCSGDSGDDISMTEAQRKSVNPLAVRYLIGAQDALRDKAYGNAMTLTDSVHKYAPNLPDLYFMRALIFTELRRYNDAEASYQQVLAIDPEYEGVYINLGSTAHRQGDSRKALNYFRKEFEHHPSAHALHQIGRMYATEGKPDSALMIYNEALAFDSLSSLSYLRIAEIYKEEGELDTAIDYAEKGLALEPENVNYRHFMGSLLLLTGDAPGAEKHLQMVVEKRPWHYWGNFNLGQALLRQGKEEAGQKYTAKAEALQKELKNIQDWEQLAENNPDQLMLWVNLGEAYYRSGRHAEAIEAFNIALNIEPRFVAVESNLATLYVLEGDTATAIHRLLNIIQRYPSFAEAWLNLGVVYANSGNKTEARKAWRKVLELLPDDKTAKSYLEKLEKI